MANFVTYPSNPKNNNYAHLDVTIPKAIHYDGMINFLNRSRIRYAISQDYPAYNSHQQLFWNSVEKLTIAKKIVLRATILDKTINIIEEDIRRVLRFSDNELAGVTTLNRYLVKGCLRRMGYVGDIDKGVAKKSCFPLQYKYLAHVLHHCLETRKGSFDDLRETFQSVLVALALNKSFNFSAMIMEHWCENIDKIARQKFLLYPRFLQMIIDDKLGANTLPKADADKFKFEHMNDISLSKLKPYQKSVEPPAKELFGHFINENYEAPNGRKWRHDNSGNENEDMSVFNRGDDDDDEGDEAPQTSQTSGRKKRKSKKQKASRLVDEPEVEIQTQESQAQPEPEIEPQSEVLPEKVDEYIPEHVLYSHEDEQDLYDLLRQIDYYESPSVNIVHTEQMGSAIVAEEHDNVPRYGHAKFLEYEDLYGDWKAENVAEESDSKSSDEEVEDQFQLVRRGAKLVEIKHPKLIQAEKEAKELEENPDFEFSDHVETPSPPRKKQKK